MPGSRLKPALAALALALACLSDSTLRPPGRFFYSAAARACGPTDGPAVGIYLATVPVESLAPPAPYIRIAVWQPLEHLAGGSWLIAAGDTSADAWYYTAPNHFEVATGGHVMVMIVQPDTTIEGSVDVTFLGAGRITGGFRSLWIASAPLCG